MTRIVALWLICGLAAYAACTHQQLYLCGDVCGTLGCGSYLGPSLGIEYQIPGSYQTSCPWYGGAKCGQKGSTPCRRYDIFVTFTGCYGWPEFLSINTCCMGDYEGALRAPKCVSGKTAKE